jgi:propanol-preferring alcohol dehydrogenase
MKAMRLRQIGAIETAPLEWVEMPSPEPQEGEIRLRVECCAVCRTDLHVIEGDIPQQKMPIVPGHQIVGVVDALGVECRRFSLGQRVGVAWLRSTCGHCEFCLSARENLCAETRFTGYHVDGGYAQQAVVREDFAYPIPAQFDSISAAPLLCAGIIGYRSLQRSRLPPGGKLALYGFGSSAHVVIQIAQHRGAEVYVATREEKHRQLAKAMGAVWVGARPEALPVKVDSAIIFAPAGTLVPPALESLKKGGTLALAGIHMSPVPQMDYDRYLFYERDLRSVTCNTQEDGRQLLAEAAAIPIRPRTTVYPLADANRALQDLKADRISGTAVLAVE